jgi:glycosyltransferase involved in cell wall biosynthesis
VTIISRQYKNFPPEEIVGGVRHIRIASSDRTSSLALNLALDLRYALRVAHSLPPSDVTITNSFFLPLLLPRHSAGKIYVHVARFPKGQMALYFRADRLQAISRAVADAIIEQVPRVADRVVSIGYPVPDDYFRAAPAPLRHRTVLFVGRIAREKGVHLLIKAFASAMSKLNAVDKRGWKLRIVGPHDITQGGDGVKYLTELKALAAPLGSDCEFLGPVFEQETLIHEYRSASIFVYPSLAEKGEAFGLAALEAMASGCSIIVSNLRCFDDFVEHEKNGLKFDHRGVSPEGKLGAELTKLMMNPHILNSIATRGRLAAKQFSTGAIAARMLDDFACLTGRLSG